MFVGFVDVLLSQAIRPPAQSSTSVGLIWSLPVSHTTAETNTPKRWLSAGPIPRGADLTSVHYCSATTPTTDDCRNAGRAGTGMTDKELKRLAAVLSPLQVARMPLAGCRRASVSGTPRLLPRTLRSD